MERKAYCVDMKDALIKYANRHQIDSEQFKMIVLELAQKMDQIDKVYETTIRHIETISLTSLSVLPKKFDDYKKALKTADQKPSPSAESMRLSGSGCGMLVRTKVVSQL